MIQFQTLNIEENRDKIIDFRRDSFVASFGDDSAFGPEDEYINWVKGYIKKFPDGFVHVKWSINWPVGTLHPGI